MKILLLTDGIAPIVMGGMQKHSRLVAEYLARKGCQITLFHYSESHIDESIVRTYFSNPANENISLHHFIYKDESHIPGHYVRAQKLMSRKYLERFLVLNESFDFIYSKGFMGWALLDQRKALKINCHIGVKFHGMNMFQKQASFKLELQKFLLQKPVRRIMEMADYVFSYGGEITKIIKEECNTPIIELPSGIEEGWLNSGYLKTTETFKFLFIGRYDRVKGLPELYGALKKLQVANVNWECHFVGPIPKEHQISLPNCKYHGAINNSQDLKEVIDRCDILINTSISEGMPNVILEGMARGLAVLATDVGATAMLVKGNGWLIQHVNEHQIFDHLQQCLKCSPKEIDSFKQESLKLIQNYTWNKIGDELILKLNQVIGIAES